MSSDTDPGSTNSGAAGSAPTAASGAIAPGQPVAPSSPTAPITSAAEPPTAETIAGDGFSALGLDPRLLHALAELGYEEATPVQREAMPPLLAGRDVLAEAPTGTGKTAAFALPALQRLAAAGGEPKAASVLVLVPTRELAMQVAEAIHRYGRELG